MKTYLEHNNITVRNLDHAIEFFTAIFPDWSVRFRGYLDEKVQDTEYAHVGHESSYLALQATPWGQDFSRINSPYFDHMAFVVENRDDVLKRMERYPQYRVRVGGEEEGRRRAYIYIFDGLILELIEYTTSDFSIKNKYS